MTPVDLALLLAMGAMFAGGIYLVLERNLTRILLGLMLVNNAAILLLFATAGGPGLAPLRVEGTDPRDYADPMPQALILTAIVIGFATTAFLAAMIYRSWLLVREDEIEVDAEDVKVARQPAWDREDDGEVPEELSEFVDVAGPSVRHAHAPSRPTAAGPRRPAGGPRAECARTASPANAAAASRDGGEDA